MSYVIFVFGPIPSFQILFFIVLWGRVRVVVGGCCVRGGLVRLDSNLNPPPFCIRLVFSFALLWLFFVSALFCRGLLCLVRSSLASTWAFICRVLTSTKEGWCACKTRPNKTQQALYVDAVLALVKGTGLAICRVATHAQAVSTLRDGRNLHVLQYEPVARLDAEREP